MALGISREVANGGESALRFAAVYASSDVVTTYETEVMPEGSRRREPA